MPEIWFVYLAFNQLLRWNTILEFAMCSSKLDPNTFMRQHILWQVVCEERFQKFLLISHFTKLPNMFREM